MEDISLFSILLGLLVYGLLAIQLKRGGVNEDLGYLLREIMPQPFVRRTQGTPCHMVDIGA